MPTIKKVLKIDDKEDLTKVGLSFDTIESKLSSSIGFSNSRNTLMFTFFYEAGITLTLYQQTQVRYIARKFNEEIDMLAEQYRRNIDNKPISDDIQKEMEAFNAGFNLDLIFILTKSQYKMYNSYIINDKFKK